MAEKIEVGVTIKGTEKVTSDLNKVDKTTKGLGSSFGGVATGLDKMTGGAVTAFRSATTGVKTFVKGLKLTRTAIIATGVGALVLGVVALVSAFVSTRKGANQLKVVMAAMGAVVERVTGYFQAAGTYLVTLFTKGHTAAVESYREEIDKLPGSMQDAIDKAIELERRTQALRTSQRDMSVAFAEGRAQIKEYNMVAEDVTRSLEDRLEAAQKAIDIEKDLMAERQRIATEERDIAKEKAAQSDSSEDDLDNLATLEVALINIRTESAEMQTTLGNKLNIISQQSAAAAKAEADAVVAAEKEKQDAYDATYEAKQKANAQILKDAETAGEYLMSKRELEAQALMFEYEDLEAAQAKKVALLEESNTAYPGELELNKQILEDIETEYNRRSLDLTKKFADEDQAIKDAASDKTIATAEATAQAVRAARLGIVAAGFEALKSMAKTEEGQKRLAISQILVNQGVAMSQAIAGATTSATALGPGAFVATPLFIAQALGLVLGSFASIKGVMNQAGASSGSVGSGGGGGGGGSTQLALTPTLESFGEGALELPAVQAYVLQNNIADADALQQELLNRSSL